MTRAVLALMPEGRFYAVRRQDAASGGNTADVVLSSVA
jgi:hypothetical protein